MWILNVTFSRMFSVVARRCFQSHSAWTKYQAGFALSYIKAKLQVSFCGFIEKFFGRDSSLKIGRVWDATAPIWGALVYMAIVTWAEFTAREGLVGPSSPPPSLTHIYRKRLVLHPVTNHVGFVSSSWKYFISTSLRSRIGWQKITDFRTIIETIQGPKYALDM